VIGIPLDCPYPTEFATAAARASVPDIAFILEDLHVDEGELPTAAAPRHGHGSATRPAGTAVAARPIRRRRAAAARARSRPRACTHVGDGTGRCLERVEPIVDPASVLLVIGRHN
jgi:hypothetical protein